MPKGIFTSISLWLIFLLPIIFGTENNALTDMGDLMKYSILFASGMCGYLAIITTIAWWNGDDDK